MAVRDPADFLDTLDVYVLTLAKYPERYEVTRRRLLEAGHGPSRIHKHLGIYGAKDPDKLREAFARWHGFHGATEFSPAQQGCSFAHLDTMETFLATDAPCC